MEDLELGAIQSRFADIIWENAPVASSELVRLCALELGWKKSTTYTVLKKLCEKGLFKNENGVVLTAISREDYMSRRSQSFVENSFSGSLPAFIAAFMNGKPISDEEADEIRHMIDSARKGERA